MVLSTSGFRVKRVIDPAMIHGIFQDALDGTNDLLIAIATDRLTARVSRVSDYAAMFWRFTLTYTLTREPSRLMTVMSRSMVKRLESAFRMREKSAAAIPVRTCALRMLRLCLSSVPIIFANGRPQLYCQRRL